MIRLACPGCDQMLRVPDAMAGRKVACPQCKKMFRVFEQESTDAGEDEEERISAAPMPAQPGKPLRSRRPAEEDNEDVDGYGVQPEPTSPPLARAAATGGHRGADASPFPASTMRTTATINGLIAGRSF